MSEILILPSGKKISSKRGITDKGNFTWGEATKNLTRVPPLIEIEENIIRCAVGLELIRTYFGNKPIRINSWYRTPIENKNVGGSTKSRHLYGDAVDMNVAGFTPRYVFNSLNKIHAKGGLGLYRTHVHLDFRGYRARW